MCVEEAKWTASNPRLSEAQPAGVEDLEPDVGVTIPQGTSRPE